MVALVGSGAPKGSKRCSKDWPELVLMVSAEPRLWLPRAQLGADGAGTRASSAARRRSAGDAQHCLRARGLPQNCARPRRRSTPKHVSRRLRAIGGDWRRASRFGVPGAVARPAASCASTSSTRRRPSRSATSRARTAKSNALRAAEWPGFARRARSAPGAVSAPMARLAPVTQPALQGAAPGHFAARRSPPCLRSTIKPRLAPSYSTNALASCALSPLSRKLASGLAFPAVGSGSRFAGRSCWASTYIVDFLAPTCRLVVEVDGPYHDRRLRADVRRDARLNALGFRVLHLETEFVMRALPLALERIGGLSRLHGLSWTPSVTLVI